MPTEAQAEREGRIRKSVHFDPDMVTWVAAQAARFSTSEASIVRQAIRAAMRHDEETVR
jgi:hypothetical protein